jgi:peptide chain release factor subunit 1
MTELSSRQRYDFKRDLEEIAQLRGQHTELISLYIPADKEISQYTNYLRSESSQASNIKSTQTRKNVQSAIESLLSRLRYYRMSPANGLVLFVGAVVTGNNQQDMRAYVFEPPQAVTTFTYRCDSTFYIDPLKDMLTEKEIYGLLLIDRRECTVGILRGKQIQTVFYDTSQVPGKHGRGGQSQRRMERLTEIAADEWYKKMGERASEVFRATPGLVGILVGGPGPSKRAFVEGKFLHYELEPKIIDLFDTGYTDEYGLRELVDNASGAMKNLGLVQEKNLMKRLLGEIRNSDAGLATYGEKQVRYALGMGAVDTLLLSEGLRRYRAKIACSSCDYTEADRTIKAAEIDAKLEEKCPKCQSRLVVKEKKDVVDELSELAESSKANVELVSQDSEEGDQLLKAFGGIAAILRYHLEIPAKL